VQYAKYGATDLDAAHPTSLWFGRSAATDLPKPLRAHVQADPKGLKPGFANSERFTMPLTPFPHAPHLVGDPATHVFHDLRCATDACGLNASARLREFDTICVAQGQGYSAHCCVFQEDREIRASLCIVGGA